MPCPSHLALPALLAFALGCGNTSLNLSTNPVPVKEVTTLEGTLEVFVEDYVDHSVTRNYIQTDSGERLELQFSNTEKAPHLLSGSRIQISGQRKTNLGGPSTFTLSSGMRVLSSATTSTTGEQKTLVLLVNFMDDTSEPFDLAYARSVVFDQTHRFYQDNSYGQMWITGDVYGWFTLPISASCTNCAISGEAFKAARAVGIQVDDYPRRIVVFTGQSIYAWAGVSQVGGLPSSATINGFRHYMIPFVIAHELGHGLGLHHSNSLDCGSTPFDPAGVCTSTEYGDVYDTMGYNPLPHHVYYFNAFSKEVLSWLSVPTITTSGIYEIKPLELNEPGEKGIKVIAQAGSKSYVYYLEYRQNIGFDQSLDPSATNGILIHTQDPIYYHYSRSILLDMTPNTDSLLDAALTVGDTYLDPVNGISFTPISRTASSIFVDIHFDENAPAPSPPLPTPIPTYTPIPMPTSTPTPLPPATEGNTVHAGVQTQTSTSDPDQSSGGGCGTLGGENPAWLCALLLISLVRPRRQD